MPDRDTQRCYRGALGIAALAILTACVSPDEKPAGYEEAAREARMHAQYGVHPLYYAMLEREVRDPFERASRRCSVSVPDARGARILYRLDSSGAPSETLVYPDAAFGRCVERATQALEFPPPPEPDYWIAVVVSPDARGRVAIPGAPR